MNEDPTARAIRVALVEDEPEVRERLERALAAAPQTCLVFATSMATPMMEWLSQNIADVLLVDIGLPDRSGIEVIRHCRSISPATEIMVVSMFADEANLLAALEAGARGYILKDGTEADLARHVLSLHAGGSPMTPVIARQLLDRLTPCEAPPARVEPAPACGARTQDAGITPREREILQLLARGYTYAEIANLLSVAPSTIQTHVKNIYSKLAVNSRAEAVFEARYLGIV